MSFVYDGVANVADQQIQQSCAQILMRIEKNTAYDTLPEFFGDVELSKSDLIKLTYSSGTNGQKALISGLSIFPIAIASTIREDHMVCETDANGKIVAVTVAIEVGVGGAIRLNQSNYLSLSTTIYDLKSLKISVLNANETDSVYMYFASHLNPTVKHDINLENTTQLILSKFIMDADFVDKEGYTINNQPMDLDHIARFSNDVMAVFGQPQNITYKKNGVVKTIQAGILETASVCGGNYYNGIPVSLFHLARVQSSDDDRAYLQKAVPVASL